MKLHAITIVRDEADIVAEALAAATAWCDGIYVFDNGSTDGTWEILQDLARADDRIVLYGSDDRPYSNLIRTELFHAFKHRSQPGDWWCKLDADEIYIDHPYQFLARIPDAYDLVFGSSFQYYFTDADLAAYEADPERYAATPAPERLRFYSNNHSEPRCVRHVDDTIWDTGHPLAPSVYPVRIWLRHYQYRSPEQMQRRVGHRMEAARRGSGFKHELSARYSAEGDGSGEEWRRRIRPAADLDYDRGDGRYVYREDRQCALPRPGIRAEARELARRVGTRIVRGAR